MAYFVATNPYSRIILKRVLIPYGIVPILGMIAYSGQPSYHYHWFENFSLQLSAVMVALIAFTLTKDKFRVYKYTYDGKPITTTTSTTTTTSRPNVGKSPTTVPSATQDLPTAQQIEAMRKTNEKYQKKKSGQN